MTPCAVIGISVGKQLLYIRAEPHAALKTVRCKSCWGTHDWTCTVSACHTDKQLQGWITPILQHNSITSFIRRDLVWFFRFASCYKWAWREVAIAHQIPPENPQWNDLNAAKGRRQINFFFPCKMLCVIRIGSSFYTLGMRLVAPLMW